MFYKLEFERYENLYYVLRAYGIAHSHAQRTFISALFGPDADLDTCQAPELTMLLESARLVAVARSELENVSPKLKGIVKSKLVAEAVLEAQRAGGVI